MTILAATDIISGFIICGVFGILASHIGNRKAHLNGTKYVQTDMCEVISADIKKDLEEIKTDVKEIRKSLTTGEGGSNVKL